MYTGTACLTLLDAATASQVWEDLLYDGHDHEHGAGGLMLNRASAGTHLEHDGSFPVTLYRVASGEVVGFEVNLDPYGEDLDSLRRPDGWTDEDEHHHADHVREHVHGHTADDGWSQPVSVKLVSQDAVLGDPAALPDADDTGGLLSLRWPGPDGSVRLSVLSLGGFRRRLRVAWSST